MPQTQELKATEIYEIRRDCRACSSPHLRAVLNLGNQYLPRFTKEIDECLPRAPLELVQCEGCGLLQLKHTVRPDLLFREFWYRSGINETMRAAMQDIVDDGLKHIDHGVWLDIGANDGWLLKCVPSTFWRIAVEPATNMRESLEAIADATISDYFPNDQVPEAKVNVVTSAAVFYDLDDPRAFIWGVKNCLTDGGIWINQLNDAPGMLKANAFDSICHEHLCYYDVPTLDRLYTECGMTITNVSFNDVNGGSIRVTAMKTSDNPKKADLLGLSHVSVADAEVFAQRVTRWKRTMGDIIAGITGPIWCYGASTKGTVLLQYLGRTRSIVAVADRNPEKWGKHMAGSWLPILSEIDFRKANPRYALVLPWAFKREFIDREREAREAGTAMIFPLPLIEVAS